jgi:hypothetical protein
LPVLRNGTDGLHQPELAIDLGKLVSGMQTDDYLVISNLPKEAQLSHGYDNGDGSWTLMSDELADLKLLARSMRGVISLKAQIFSRDNLECSVKAKRQFPLILHSDEATPWTPINQGVIPTEASSAPIKPEIPLNHEHEGAAKRSTASIAANNTEEIRGCQKSHGPVELAIADRQKGDHALNIGLKVTQSALSSKIEQRWADELDRLSGEVFSELRQEAKAALEAAEQRHKQEIKELSSAIVKQHELIGELKQQLEQSKHEATTRLSEAEGQWREAEAQRMDAARLEWVREKDEFRSERDTQAVIAEQLRAELEEMRTRCETQKRAFESRLKEAAAAAERTVSLAHSEWQGVIARCFDTGNIEIGANVAAPS